MNNDYEFQEGRNQQTTCKPHSSGGIRPFLPIGKPLWSEMLNETYSWELKKYENVSREHIFVALRFDQGFVHIHTTIQEIGG